jgi:ParB family transcriptional regulator, chromosome partitioning protein
MTSRKDQLKNLFVPVAPTLAAAPQRAASGAIKAMGLSLGGLQREIDEARQLKDALHEGDRIVEIDPALIDPSPFSDRLSDGAENDEEFAALVQSLKDSGQQVPVLLRPHSRTAGRFETAYGHRRIKAAQSLGVAVRAIVRALDDGALLLAQGKENAERRNLSFIEKALFAKGMVDAGVDRATAQAALSAHKAEMTRYLQVADAIALHIARAIGPAPKAGRPRWMALGALLQTDAGRIKAEDEMGKDAFMAADSDRRFQMLLDRLSRKVKLERQSRIVKAQGLTVNVLSDAKATRFEVADTGFAAWLEANLAALARRFTQGEGA